MHHVEELLDAVFVGLAVLLRLVLYALSALVIMVLQWRALLGLQALLLELWLDVLWLFLFLFFFLLLLLCFSWPYISTSCRLAEADDHCSLRSATATATGVEDEARRDATRRERDGIMHGATHLAEPG